MSSDLLPIIRAVASDLTPDERAAPILVGVSGGPDSLALLHALWRWRDEDGPAIAAIHIDHRLRPESADETRQVAMWCAEWRIPFAGRVAGLDRVPEANIEQVVREARYRCFAEEAARIGALTLVLAHHADDQAETLLLHLLRGSGLAGLVGMPGIRRWGDLLDPISAARGFSRPAVWRPLLSVRRAAILTYCERWQLAPIHDPSNDDTTLRRNAIRHRVLPLLEEHFPGAGDSLARAATLISSDEAFLRNASDEAFVRCAERESNLVCFDRAAFRREHLAMQRRLLRVAWSELCGVAAPMGLDAGTIDAARDAILTGATGSRFDLPAQILLIIDRATAALGPSATLAAQLRNRLGLPLVEPRWQFSVPAGGMLDLGSGWSIEVMPPDSPLALSAMLHIPVGEGDGLVFRTWQPGDRVSLPDGRGSRKLQDWLTDRHIPAYARHHLPLLARGNRVLWVVGLAAFPPVTTQPPGGVPPALGDRAPDAAGRGAISLRLLYNGTPVEPVRRR